MALNDLLRHHVRARSDEEEDTDDEETTPGHSEPEGPLDKATVSSSLDSEIEDEASQDSPVAAVSAADDDDSDYSDPRTDLETNLKDISFGALVQAQASLPVERKRKRPGDHNDIGNPESTSLAVESLRKRLRESSSGKAPKDRQRQENNTERPPSNVRPVQARSSKHAPSAQSSRYAVGRRRVVVEPAAAGRPKPRDPRFDRPVGGSDGRGLQSADAADSAAVSSRRNYGFLREYQDSEMTDLRTRIRRTRDPDAREGLERELMAMQNRRKAADSAELEREIVRRHRQNERQLIREGKKEKPWFLKKRDVKKEVLMEKFKGMNEKQREKALAKARKKKAGKEKKKHMPLTRRRV